MCQSFGDPHFTPWAGASFSFQGVGLFELATVPEADLRVDALHCRFGQLASSNAAVAFRLGGRIFEVYGNDLYIDGELQPRANGRFVLPDGSTTLVRRDNRVEILAGRVLVSVRVRFNELAPPARGARVGYWHNIELNVPISDARSSELTGLCALNGSARANETLLVAPTTIFNTSVPRYERVFEQCGVGLPMPQTCEPPGVGSCCPALPSIDDALDLCAFTQCDELALRFCLYDCERARARAPGARLSTPRESAHAARRGERAPRAANAQVASLAGLRASPRTSMRHNATRHRRRHHRFQRRRRTHRHRHARPRLRLFS